MQRQGLYGWFSKSLRGKKGQQGFTLIELLVVVTILGVLAAIVTLSLVGLTTNANVQACNSEYKTVQSAIDAYMADKQLSSIPVQSAWTNDMSNGAPSQATGNLGNGTIPLWVAAPSSSNPNYTRNGTTQYFYTWLGDGRINGIGSNSSGASISGCVPH